MGVQSVTRPPFRPAAGLVALALFLACAPAFAQQAQSNGRHADSNKGASAQGRAQRTAEREQALADLDSADPILRLGTFEDITKSGDPLLIELAEKKVLAGTDKQLESLAIRQVLSSANYAFIMHIEQCGGGSICSDIANGNFGGVLKIRFEQVNLAAGDFITYETRVAQKQNFIKYRGKSSGDRIEVGLDLMNLYSSGDFKACQGTFTLKGGDAMSGTVQCGDKFFTGNFGLF